MPNGKYKGELISRIPPGYLKWMVSSCHQYMGFAKAELERRGTTESSIEITAHAIDRASQRLLDIWQRERKDAEGLHSWLARISADAIERALVNENHPNAENVRTEHLGVVWVFEMKFVIPVLKSVWLAGEQEAG